MNTYDLFLNALVLLFSCFTGACIGLMIAKLYTTCADKQDRKIWAQKLKDLEAGQGPYYYKITTKEK